MIRLPVLGVSFARDARVMRWVDEAVGFGLQKVPARVMGIMPMNRGRGRLTHSNSLL